MSSKKKALGRGLSALLENSETDITSSYALRNNEAVGSIATIPVERIEANPFQPRTHFEKEPLAELAASIKEHGIIQPLTVRKLGYDKYQLISGERRFKASQIAGLTEVPVYIRVANDQTMLEMALVENIQRENLDAIEVAISFKRLIDECSITQEALGERVSKNRSTVTNYLRLLKLPAEIQLGIREKKISMGHARALISIPDEAQQLSIYRTIIAEKLSVRKAEELARGSAPKKKTTPKEKMPLSFQQQQLKSELSQQLDTKVDITKGNKGTGKLVISFASDSDLKRIIELLDI
jgi:ParB family chromosome partitioning protein